MKNEKMKYIPFLSLSSVKSIFTKEEFLIIALSGLAGGLAQQYLQDHPELIIKKKNKKKSRINLNRKEVRFLIGIFLSGGFLSRIYQRSLKNKNQPELFDENLVGKEKIKSENKRRGFQREIPRGGAFVSIKLKIVKLGLTGAKIGINIIADKGFWLLVTGSAGIVTVTQHSCEYLTDAFPQHLPDYSKTKTRYIPIDGENLLTDECGKAFSDYLDILVDPALPAKERSKTIKKLLKSLKFDSLKSTSTALICLGTVLFILSRTNTLMFDIFLQEFLEAIREGRISKRIVRLILRKLRRKNPDVFIPDEFVKAISENVDILTV